MTLRRRQILRAAAVSPAFVLSFGFTRHALATSNAPPVSGNLRLPTPDGGGFSISWEASSGVHPTSTVRGLAGDVWSERFPIHPDHHDGPDAPEGRTHSQAILVPGATEYELSSTNHKLEYQVHQIKAPARVVSKSGRNDLSRTEPIPGLEIIDRHNWTNRERKNTIDCVIGSSVFSLGCRSDVGIRHAIVHHTVNVNSYTEADVPDLLDGIQRYHMDTRGWDDIAYNFVIDRFGRIWQGRQADMFEPISGGHTTGLNAESVGVALLGTFTDRDPGQPMVNSLGILLGWKLGLHGVDPLGETLVRSNGGDYAERDEMVLVDNISPHRANQTTQCPGDGTIARLDQVRQAAAEMVSVFGTIVPRYSLDQIAIHGWAIDRLAPTSTVDVDVIVDHAHTTVVPAQGPVNGLDVRYPESGEHHGFAYTVPIGLDTTSITVVARTEDDRTAKLMDLRLFATFIDVEPHRFFAAGIYWLRKNELTTGTQPGLFEPMDKLSRAQMATFLWRFMDCPLVADASPFIDVARNSWYDAATDWLFASGITTGTAPDLFAPDEIVTRAQMATFLWRLCGSIIPVNPSPFQDVPSGRYFTTAVAWLYETEITTGVTSNHFDPNAFVTRGQMATFLHRLATTSAAWTVVTPPPVVVL
ncbi:MAG: hypothetical protein HOH36_00760 [Acidimicrobiaceae bacterium]|jgi:hypothetical protein|nr:hypothetical protein [Acidimicrobiaceae bacterium]MBT5848946.1 hypothetical protein [Acidimicrobiaceae bacterium]